MNDKLKVLDLFSGIGGFSLGLERTGGFETTAFCELESFPRAVLARHWPTVACHTDVRALDGTTITADVVCGGFPCQDISLAGKGAGLAGERSGLWSEFHRLIKEIKPKYAIIENVSALRSRGLDEVLRSLTEIGYDAEWHCIPASAVGAPHRRDRIWIIAYPHPGSFRLQGIGAQAVGSFAQHEFEGLLQHTLRTAVPAGRLGGICDGVSNRSHRLKGLGNAVVPQVVEIIGRAILSAEGLVDV